MFRHPSLPNTVTQKCCALLILLSFGTSGLTPCWAGSDFAANWQPKPLIDHSAPSPGTPGKGSSISSPASVEKNASALAEQAAMEEKLKPAAPFISSVEKQLLVTPKAGTSLVQRLNTLQNVLYGESRFQDAGELLSEMARLFPTEAAKAAADLQAKLQAEKRVSSQPPVNKTNAQSAKKMAGVNQPIPTTPAMTNLPPNNNPSPGKKKRFWQSEDDPFANDPFFQDQPSRNTSSNFGGQQTGPSKLASIGQGLAGLAMMAGAVASSYYLNRGNNALPPQNGYYNNLPYGYPPYGAPYGFGNRAFGQIPGQIPYGYNTIHPYAYPGGMTMNTLPYRPYGINTLSPFGTTTRVIPY